MKSLYALLALVAVAAAEPFDPSRFEKEVLVPASYDAIQMEVLPNGDIIFVEFWGTVKRWDHESGVVITLGQIETHAKGEVGLLGFAVARDFLETGFLYALFCPAEKQDTMRVSRFTVKDDIMPLDSEVELLSFAYDTEHVYHMGGAMWMDGKGDLYMGNGDNCHWNPGLPVDMREGRKSWDAFRSAANSRDMRGKILRIHPEPDGSYSIPKDNLFADGKDGLPEIYVMGVRNPFRISVDDADGTLYIGDVGPNVLPELGITPVGYEEINATRKACNFGWPSFIGPNEPLPLYDFDKEEIGAVQDPASPENPSPNNTGIRQLPAAKPALIWYDNLPSERFPTLSSGGRSILAGPVYRYDENNPSEIKLPKELDGRLFICEWMRNWIQTVKLGTEGPEIEPFVPDWNLRRPVDMKIGPDGALYMIEYGDQWWENNDSRIVRIGYKRGNRPPVFEVKASATAGKAPLRVTFDTPGAHDPDGDDIKFSSGWVKRMDGSKEPAGENDLYAFTFTNPGVYTYSIALGDDKGGWGSAESEPIVVGNARPNVVFENPTHGSFFDWGEEIAYQIEVSDEDSDVDAALASIQGLFRERRFLEEGNEAFVDPGLALMRKSTCFACHLSDAPSAGPPYEEIALKYAEDPAAAETLSQKIISGGTGVWGELPMPPHPQHTIDQAREMVAWVLSLKDKSSDAPKPGSNGTWTAPPKPKAGTRADEGVLILTAGYTDSGAEGAPPLRGEAEIVLHSRRKKAALYDENHGMEYIEQVEGEKGILGHFESGDHIVWRDLNLDGITDLVIRAGGLSDHSGTLELRQDSPDGALLAEVEVKPTGEGEFNEIPTKLRGEFGLTDICVVARFKNPDQQLLGVNWIEFKE